jgi:hypothetical protein
MLTETANHSAFIFIVLLNYQSLLRGIKQSTRLLGKDASKKHTFFKADITTPFDGPVLLARLHLHPHLRRPHWARFECRRVTAGNLQRHIG